MMRGFFFDSSREQYSISYSSSPKLPSLLAPIEKVILSVNSSKPVRGLNISIENSNLENFRPLFYFDQSWLSNSFIEEEGLNIFDRNHVNYETNADNVGVTIFYQVFDNNSGPNSIQENEPENSTYSQNDFFSIYNLISAGMGFLIFFLILLIVYQIKKGKRISTRSSPDQSLI